MINASFVENTIGDFLFHPDDVEEVNHARAIKLFKKLEDPDFAYKALAGCDLYKDELKPAQRLHLLT